MPRISTARFFKLLLSFLILLDMLKKTCYNPLEKGSSRRKLRDLVNILEEIPGHFLNDETLGVGGSVSILVLPRLGMRGGIFLWDFLHCFCWLWV